MPRRSNFVLLSYHTPSLCLARSCTQGWAKVGKSEPMVPFDGVEAGADGVSTAVKLPEGDSPNNQTRRKQKHRTDLTAYSIHYSMYMHRLFTN